MDPRNELATLLQRLPGVGPKQAQRFAYFIATQPVSFSDRLSRICKEVQHNSKVCTQTGALFISNDPAVTTSPIVRNHRRRTDIAMIVPNDLTLDRIEQTQTYTGQYLVLGGLVPLSQAYAPAYLRVELIRTYLTNHASDLQEIIMSFPATTEGDHTYDILQEVLTDLATTHHLKITRLGRGLSTGTELEYIDPATMEAALGGRR